MLRFNGSSVCHPDRSGAVLTRSLLSDWVVHTVSPALDQISESGLMSGVQTEFSSTQPACTQLRSQASKHAGYVRAKR